MKKKNALDGLIRDKAKKEGKEDRKVKGFSIGTDYARAFDVLKAETGIPGPELAEEALNLLFVKYGKKSLKS